ncbi:hypothetical protein M404DRAFT_275135 [Pisolithus tinctorius Marx 270]|uniref:Uncharacterized protein n=1 Tax=Pisolithus tinctorius Marx 270 TaxID=870435 RepID=A0A0C3PMK3_PISTI|nr:hypothetical protein M404DRAFT_275135 [Pisolithus tinctorius Marx 270]
MFFLAKSPPLGLRSPRGIYSSLPASFSFLRALPRFVDVFGVNDIPKCMEIPGRRLRYPYPRQQTRRKSLSGLLCAQENIFMPQYCGRIPWSPTLSANQPTADQRQLRLSMPGNRQVLPLSPTRG